VQNDILKYVHDKGEGTGPREEVGTVLYNRGLIIAMLSVEAVRRAQEHFGKGKPMTGEQVRWGLENMALDQKRLDALGFGEMIKPFTTSCSNHIGASYARIQTWDGTKWVAGDLYEADQKLLTPMADKAAEAYAATKNIAKRTDCQS